MDTHVPKHPRAGYWARYYAGKNILVAGAGVSARSVVPVLLDAGASVWVMDQRDSEALSTFHRSGAQPLIAPEQLPDEIEEVVVSPGWRRDEPVIAHAVKAGVPTYAEPEFAWKLTRARVADTGAPMPWLAVSGTNGKTTTVTMLDAVLRAAGVQACAVGNIGRPLTDAVVARSTHDALAVELSSFQLHWSDELAPEIGALLNIADDHLDWHGGREQYWHAKSRIWRSAQRGPGVMISTQRDAVVQHLADTLRADRRSTHVSVTLAEPRPGQLGVCDGVLVEHLGDEPRELLSIDQVQPSGVHNTLNALAASAAALSYGVTPQDVASGLRVYTPEAHRNQILATVQGVQYVNDSKATNPHAAEASLENYSQVVWIAGGQLKGVEVSELVRTHGHRLRGAVLFGVDRDEIASALEQYVPDVPVVNLPHTNPEVIAVAVDAASSLASAGDTVLLAPAAASRDIFSGYEERGDEFMRAVWQRAHRHSPSQASPLL